jgi:ADP-ribose pyrophosphatase YjhB (NUDIX family)
VIVDHRVRAILINNINQLVLTKRLSPRFWSVPGVGITATDESFEQALEREIREGLGGNIEVLKLVYRLEHQIEEERYAQQHFFLCRLAHLDGKAKNSPEYVIEEVPLRVRELQSLDIRPPALKRFLLDNCGELFELPDLRQQF